MLDQADFFLLVKTITRIRQKWKKIECWGLRRGARRRFFRWWCGIWIPVPIAWIAGLGTILLLVWHIVMNPIKVYLVSRVFPAHHHSWIKLRGPLSHSSPWDLLVVLERFWHCLHYLGRLCYVWLTFLAFWIARMSLFRISCQPPRQYHSQRRQHFFHLLGPCKTLNFKLQSWNILSIPGDIFFSLVWGARPPTAKFWFGWVFCLVNRGPDFARAFFNWSVERQSGSQTQYLFAVQLSHLLCHLEGPGTAFNLGLKAQNLLK